MYPEGDWRNAALEASLSDEGRLHREARGRNVTYMLKVTYDGEAYLGFQYQPRDATVQGEIEKALSKLTGEDRGFSELALPGAPTRASTRAARSCISTRGDRSPI